MHSAKKTQKKSKGMDCPIGMPYPTLYLNAEQAPSLAGQEVGQNVKLVMECCIIGHSINENKNDNEKKRRENFDLQIEKIGMIK